MVGVDGRHGPLLLGLCPQLPQGLGPREGLLSTVGARQIDQHTHTGCCLCCRRTLPCRLGDWGSGALPHVPSSAATWAGAGCTRVSRQKEVSCSKPPGFARPCPEHSRLSDDTQSGPSSAVPEPVQGDCLNYCHVSLSLGWTPSQPLLVEQIGNRQLPLCAQGGGLAWGLSNGLKAPVPQGAAGRSLDWCGALEESVLHGGCGSGEGRVHAVIGGSHGPEVPSALTGEIGAQAQGDGCSELRSAAPLVVSARFGPRGGGLLRLSAHLCPYEPSRVPGAPDPGNSVLGAHACYALPSTSSPVGGLLPCRVTSGPCRFEQL